MAHVPVLLTESIGALRVRLGGTYVDCTVGGGGHAQVLLETGVHLIGLDADPRAIKATQDRLGEHKNLTLINENFSHLADVCERLKIDGVDGILFDLGISSLQIETSGRGFSFMRDEPLDMRFSPQQSVTAADIVNNYSTDDLAKLIGKYGEGSRSRSIAAHIVRNRPITTSGQLAEIVARAAGRRGRIHPATQTFQALRIAVNSELDNLKSGLAQAIELLLPGGRIAVISFHSLEDGFVKEIFRKESNECICPVGTPVCICNHEPRLKLIRRKSIQPTSEEIANNPRSRSARLRVAEKV
jgi:16S rRNA (cytosine1402-N4)-methyltransferase